MIKLNRLTIEVYDKNGKNIMFADSPIEKNGMVYDQVFERQRIETLLKYLVTEIKTEVREEMLRELNRNYE